jgi:hypothetical protein
MRKFGIWIEVVVKDDERAFLARDGRFVRLLPPGRFTAFILGLAPRMTMPRLPPLRS